MDIDREKLRELLANSVPPETEPERQHYYIDILKEIVKDFKEKHGFAPSAKVVTFGCPKYD